jgi:hypothetical protein
MNEPSDQVRATSAIIDGDLIPPTRQLRELRAHLGRRTVRQMLRRGGRAGLREIRARHPVRETFLHVLLFVLILSPYIGLMILRSIGYSGDAMTPAYVTARICGVGYLCWFAYRSIKRANRSLLRRKALAHRNGHYPNCLRCDYDVSHVASDTCPECGEPVLLVRFDARAARTKKKNADHPAGV